jgi:hypothetical protein
MSPRRFFLILLFGILGGLATVATFNFVVDPFWYFRAVELPGFNAVKTKFVRFERHVKPALVAREKPEAIIFGSSFAEIGFDPLNSDFTEGGRLSGYNFGVAGAGWSMVQCYIEHALAHARPKRILVGIGLEPMPRVDCRQQLADMASPDLVSFLLSTDALQASIHTVWNQRKEVGSHTRQGLFYYARAAPGVDSRFRDDLQTFLQACPIHEPAGVHRVTPESSVPPRRENLDLSGLTFILKEAAKKKVDVFAVVYPVHAYLEELGYRCGNHRTRWATVGEFAEVVHQAAAGAGTRIELWDFTGYNRFTGERVTSGPMRYWQDPRHFNVELGDFMLATIFGTPEASRIDFGYRVLPGTEAKQLGRVMRERQSYIADHSWFLPDLERLLSKAGGEPSHAAGR